MNGLKPKPVESRFWPKVRIGGPDQCWPWQASRQPKGYGQIRADSERGATLRAHRVSWELTNGAIPEGLCVLHRCDNPSCCNPNHLFLGTPADNTADMLAKGRAGCRPQPGEANPSAKLNIEKVNLILRLQRCGGFTHRTIARMFGVSGSAVDAIISGRTWVNVPGVVRTEVAP